MLRSAFDQSKRLERGSNHAFALHRTIAPAKSRPILLDFDGSGIEITELSNFTTFTDTSGDGLKHRTAWAGAGDGVLFIDADGTGALSNSHEYVFTEWAAGSADDLDALRRAFDTNGDGKLKRSISDKYGVVVA
jgi:hypothetical protein